MMVEYYASLYYKERTRITNRELITLLDFAEMYRGDSYKTVANHSARCISFIFGQQDYAQSFAKASKGLEKIVNVVVGKIR